MSEDQIPSKDIVKVSRENFREKVDNVSKHPFEFGYLYALRKESAEIKVPPRGHPTLSHSPARVEDPVWFGACTDDVELSLLALGNLPEGVIATPQKLEINELGAGLPGGNHFKLLIEDSSGIVAEVDHCHFFRTIFSPENSEVVTWRDLDKEEIGKIPERQAHEEIRIEDLPFTEFTLGGKDGIAYLSLYNKLTSRQIEAIIDVVMSEQGAEPKSFSVIFSFSKNNKEKDLEKIKDGDFEIIKKTDEGGGMYFVQDIEIEGMEELAKAWLEEIADHVPYRKQKLLSKVRDLLG